MRQRAMIAMALSTMPKLLLADEPTTALDVTIQAQVIDLIKNIVAEYKMGVIFITHDLSVIAQTVDYVAARIVRPRVVFPEPDSPTNPTKDPFLIFNETFLTARIFCFFDKKFS